MNTKLNTKTNRTNQSGYAVVVVVILLAFVFFAVGASFLQIQSTATTDGKALQKEKIAYLGEGLSEIANKLSQDYLSSDHSPTSTGLSKYVLPKIYAVDVTPYVIDSMSLSLGSWIYGAIPSGPFVGMDSYQVPLQFSLRMKDPSGSIFGQISKTSVLAKLTLFQFTYFSDLSGGTTYLAPGMPMDVQGRIHVNGDFCAGNYGVTVTPLRMQKVTVAGKAFNLRDSSCWTLAIPVANATQVSVDNSFSIFSELKPYADDGCVNCDGTGLDWRVYAQTQWKGNLLDTAHQVPFLKLPINGADQVQDGVRADASPAVNHRSLRLLVDPVLSGDVPEILQQKFSNKADIRIINGVWYLKNPAASGDWPGIPIWSDHPGSFVTEREEGIEGAIPVGQADIRARWTGTPNAWPAGSAPHLYSYYEYDSVSGTLVSDPNGAVSYGTLFRVPSVTPRWEPGQWVNVGSGLLCDPGFACTNCSSTAPLDALVASSVACSGGAQPALPDFLLNSTRSGYRDGTVGVTSFEVPNRLGLSRIYPLNFDVSGFQKALASRAPGELGSYFGAGSFMGAPFNGIVYITQTWKGSMAGVGGGVAADYPFQGSQVDASQLPPTHAAQQRALPFPLCSASSATLPGGLAGKSFSGASGRFKIPDCAKYSFSYTGADAIGARPNVVRVINASAINAALLGSGLSVVTNMPAYLLGDFNTSSDTSSAMATPWAPVLVGADQTTLLSNNWDDANSRWDVSVASLSRVAVDTTYNLSMLTGGVGTLPTAWSGGLENLPRFLEKWNTLAGIATASVRGSMVQGFSSVYFRNPVGPSVPAAWGDYTYLPPRRDFRFDDHLQKFVNQPPGAPSFDIYSVMTWSSQ